MPSVGPLQGADITAGIPGGADRAWFSSPETAMLLSWVAALSGGFVLLAWGIGSLGFIGLNEQGPKTIYAALVILTGGTSVALLGGGHRLIAIALACLMTLTGLLSGLEYLMVHDARFAELFSDTAISRFATPGRVSLSVWLNTLSLGAAVLLVSIAQRVWIAMYLAGTLIAVLSSVALSAILGKLVSLRIVIGSLDYSGMAIPTAIAFLALGLALLIHLRFARTDNSSHYFKACFLAVAGTLIGINWWLSTALRDAADEQFRKQAQGQVDRVAAETEEYVKDIADEVALFSTQMANLTSIDLYSWETAAARYLNSAPAIKGLLMIDDDNEVLSSVVNTLRNNALEKNSFVGKFNYFPAVGTQQLSEVISLPGDASPDALWSHMAILIPDLTSRYRHGHTVAIIDVQRITQMIVRQHADKAISSRLIPLSNTELSAQVSLPEGSAKAAWFETSLRVLTIPALLNIELPMNRNSSQYALINAVEVAGLAMSAAMLAALLSSRRSRKYARLARDREMRWHHVVEAAPNSMMLVNQKGIVEMVNKHCQDLLGYEKSELLGMSVERLMTPEAREHYESRQPLFWRMPRAQDVGTGGTFLILTKQKVEIPVEVGLSPMATDTGLKVLVAVVDVSERERFISDLSRSNEELDRFAYVASHDLKSPLRGLDQIATWLTQDNSDKLSEGSLRHLKLLRSRVNRMESLLDDLLAYSRVGRIKNEVETVSVDALLRGVVDLHVTDSRFTVEIGPNMPTMTTQKVPLELVFRNLIGNAIKHHDKDTGTISITATQAEPWVVFEVADDGPGIAPEFRERVFELFSTLNSRDKKEGSGIGLTIVMRTIESLGGSVSLHDNQPRGTIVRLRWPLIVIS